MILTELIEQIRMNYGFLKPWSQSEFSRFPELSRDDITEYLIYLGLSPKDSLGAMRLYLSSDEELTSVIQVPFSRHLLHQVTAYLVEEKRVIESVASSYRKKSPDVLSFPIEASSETRALKPYSEFISMSVIEFGDIALFYSTKDIQMRNVVMEPSIIDELVLLPKGVGVHVIHHKSTSEALRKMISSMHADSVEITPFATGINPDKNSGLSLAGDWMENLGHRLGSAYEHNFFSIRRAIGRTIGYHLDRYIQDKPDDSRTRVLELGCYDGFMLQNAMRAAADKGNVEFYGLDSNPHAVRLSRQNIGQKAKVIHTSAKNISDKFSSDSLDFIIGVGLFNFGVLNYRDASEILLDAQRTLKMGGRMIIGGYSECYFRKEDYERFGFKTLGCSIPPLLYPNEHNALVQEGFYVLEKTSQLPKNFKHFESTVYTTSKMRLDLERR